MHLPNLSNAAGSWKHNLIYNTKCSCNNAKVNLFPLHLRTSQIIINFSKMIITQNQTIKIYWRWLNFFSYYFVNFKILLCTEKSVLNFGNLTIYQFQCLSITLQPIYNVNLNLIHNRLLNFQNSTLFAVHNKILKFTK